MDAFRIVIPARYESTRLPGKVLLDICGKPMIQHVWDRATESGAAEVIIATDNDKVKAAAESFGATVCMTSSACQSGTDRVAEVCSQLNWSNDLPVVNVQGDAPLIPACSIRAVAELLHKYPQADMSTLCVKCIGEEDFLDPNVVKVVFSEQSKALYFSRSPIPARGHDSSVSGLAWRHLGLYGYRVEALQTLSATRPCELELRERLEQLRALWLGMDIRVAVDDSAIAPDVDTAEDLEKVAALIKSG